MTTVESTEMTMQIPPEMTEVMRLTKAGKLAEATAAIQQMLHPRVAAPAATASNTIDADYTVLEQPSGTAASVPTGKSVADGSVVSRFDIAGTLKGLAARFQRATPEPVRPDTARDADVSDAPRPSVQSRGRGSFTTASFANAAGGRAYKLYVPANRHGPNLPLIVMLHGCTQNPDDFAAGTGMNAFAEEHGCIIAYPAQPASANPQKCWSWFSPQHQQRDGGEPSIIAGITRQVIAAHAVDPDRIYVAGLSAGGALAAIMGATYPELYAAVGVHSGLPVGAAHSLPSALAAMSKGPRTGIQGREGARAVPTIIFHGDQDTTVHPRNGDQLAADATATNAQLRSTVVEARAPGGKAYTRTVYRDATDVAHCEIWRIQGAGHAWSGGSSTGTYTDPAGPNAAREMLRFFLQHKLR